MRNAGVSVCVHGNWFHRIGTVVFGVVACKLCGIAVVLSIRPCRLDRIKGRRQETCDLVLRHHGKLGEFSNLTKVEEENETGNKELANLGSS